jgi:MerR family transcriptional regulator/heat shock protein HspR
MDETVKLFVISVAAELSGMHPQTLRQYDRLGLVVPERTAGHSRRYSMRDIVQLREVRRLSEQGVSLEGIRRILDLENEVHALRDRCAELERALDEALEFRPGGRVFAAGAEEGSVVRLSLHRRRIAPGSILVRWSPRGADRD